MKLSTIVLSLAASSAGLLLVSCSWIGLHRGSSLHLISNQSYQRGLLEGKAQEVRRSFHEDQKEKERPTPPPEIEYYEMPVPAHTSSDGVKIEAHTVTVPIVKK